MRKQWTIASILSIMFLQLVGQTKVEVITKKIEESLAHIPGYTIKVVGESAKIEVVGWDRKEIKVEMRLISKGLTREQAERELDYQKYLIDDVDKTHVIKNFLLVPNELKELNSIQETEIYVWVPKNSELVIENQFGKTSLTEFDGELLINNQYGSVDCSQLTGKAEIVSHFGDLVMNSFEGELELKLTHTETKLERFKGTGDFTSSLGDLAVEVLGVDDQLKINGLKSDVRVEVALLDSYYWSIKSRYGRLVGPERLINKVQSIRNIKVELGDPNDSEIIISTDFGEILVNEL